MVLFWKAIIRRTIISAMLGEARGTTEGQRGCIKPSLKRNWKRQGKGFSPLISGRTHSCGHFHFSFVRPDQTSDLQSGLQKPGKVLRSGWPECFPTGAAVSKRLRIRRIRAYSCNLKGSSHKSGLWREGGGGWWWPGLNQDKAFGPGKRIGFILNETGSFWRVLRG